MKRKAARSKLSDLAPRMPDSTLINREHPFKGYTLPDERLKSIFSSALRALLKGQAVPEIEASFYPYAGLSSTIRMRRGRIYARVSDLLRHSPSEVLYALACILVARLYRRKEPKEHLRTYREYTSQPDLIKASDAARRDRGSPPTGSPRGKAYDLEELFEQLNNRYFAGRLSQPQLSWSKRRSWRVLGYHDHVHGSIIISRTLDDKRIPRFVLEYVLYHEMLHVKHPPKLESGRMVYHSRAFRADERLFEFFEEALKFLDQFSSITQRKLTAIHCARSFQSKLEQKGNHQRLLR
jgi:hypothetical protein